MELAMRQSSQKNPDGMEADEVTRDVLRTYVPQGTQKRLARLTGAKLSTTEGWVQKGSWPQRKHLGALVREFGADLLLALFAQEIEDHEARLDRDIARLEAQKAASEARRKAAARRQGMAQIPSGTQGDLRPDNDR